MSNEDWMERVLAAVSAHEGGYDSLNLNTDGAGLSMGILQWAQGPGQLGVLVLHMQAADPARCERIFGDNWGEMAGVAVQGKLVPVKINRSSQQASMLWKSPWKERFLAAGQDPVFQTVQRDLAMQGEHFRGGLKAAQVFGYVTERSVALLFDRATQQGPRRAYSLATAAHGMSYQSGLQAISLRAAGRYRRFTEPKDKHWGRSKVWRLNKDGTWHAWAGKADLYRGITRRSHRILLSPDLSDLPIEL